MIFNLRTKEVLGVIESDSTELIGSYDSTLKINKIGGVCVQGENPSPSNPQEIKKSVVSKITTHGKNHVKNTATSQEIKGVKFTVNEDGTVLVNGKATETFNYVLDNTLGERLTIGDSYRLSGCPTGGSKETYRIDCVRNGVTTYMIDGGYGSAVYTVTENTINPIIRIWISEGVELSNLLFKPMLRKADIIDDTYESYKESVITLSQPIELYGAGDVQDVIKDGKVIRRFAEPVLDGSENWVLASIGVFYTKTKNVNVKERGYGMCEKYAYSVTGNPAQGYFDTAFSQLRFNSTEETVEEWKAYLQANPMKVVYEMTEPVIEDLPLTDQLALSWLKTFHGVTHVEFDGEVQPTLNSEYATNLEGAITLQAHADNKIGKANTLVNRAEGDNDTFEVRVEHGLVYLYKDDVLHGMVGANNVITNNTTYKTMNVRADKNADFIALTNEKTNTVCYYMNINKVPFTSNNYTEPHYFGGDMRLVGNLNVNDIVRALDVIANKNVQATDILASNDIRGNSIICNKIGIGSGAIQDVEWVYDQALGRYVLCTVTGQ